MIMGCPELTDEAIVRLSGGCPHIMTIVVGDCPKVTDLGVCSLLRGCWWSFALSLTTHSYRLAFGCGKGRASYHPHHDDGDTKHPFNAPTYIHWTPSTIQIENFLKIKESFLKKMTGKLLMLLGLHIIHHHLCATHLFGFR